MYRKLELVNKNNETKTIDLVYDPHLTEKKKIKRKFNIVFNEFYSLFNLLGSKGRLIKYILTHARKNNQLRATNKYLAKKINVSESLIKKYMKELKEIGFISRSGSIITINPLFFNKSISDYKNNLMYYNKKEFKNENSEFDR